jgi:hypothetical protein
MRGRRALFPLAACLLSAAVGVPLHLAQHDGLFGGEEAAAAPFAPASPAAAAPRDSHPGDVTLRRGPRSLGAGAECPICCQIGHGLLIPATRLVPEAPVPAPAPAASPPWPEARLRHPLVPRGPPAARS